MGRSRPSTTPGTGMFHAPVLLGFATLTVAAALSSTSTGTADGGDSSKGSHLGEAFTNSFAMIIVNELGDKTFFIAALLAMCRDRRAVFLGAATALAAMTVLSSAMGLMLPKMLPRTYTKWAAVCLFMYFGAKLLWEGLEMLRTGAGAGPSGELEEVEAKLKDSDPQEGVTHAVVWQALSLTFLAEWGDRSQISTIALAAAKDPLGVTLGGIAGHCCCTSLAVLGGRVLATRISERAIVIAGGSLFLIFGLHGAVAALAGWDD